MLSSEPGTPPETWGVTSDQVRKIAESTRQEVNIYLQPICFLEKWLEPVSD